MGIIAANGSAQTRVGVQFGRAYHRPSIVRHYYYPGNPFWYNGYYGSPYWNQYSERYYDRKSVRTARNRLQKDEYKFNSDGIITPKEQKKLDSDYYKLNRDRDRLRNDW